MTQHEISTPEQLNVALSASALRKHAELWKAAEGRSFRWAEALGVVGAIGLLAVGIARGFSQDAAGAVPLVLGVLMLVSFIWGHMQRQLNALVALVRKLEGEHSSASRSV